MDSIPLYIYKSEEISISIQAYFEGSNLVIDGYDIGKNVEEYWGDNDYEYMVTIPPKGVDFLAQYLGVSATDRSMFLKALALKFNSNHCYSEIRKLMEDNGIDCTGFTWA